jgi:predicted nucleotidyltransferase
MKSSDFDNLVIIEDSNESAEIVIVFDTMVLVRTIVGKQYKLVSHCDLAIASESEYDVPRNNIIALGWYKECQKRKNGNRKQSKKHPQK